MSHHFSLSFIWRSAVSLAVLGSGFVVACRPAAVGAPAPAQVRTAASPRVVPEPASVTLGVGDAFAITPSTSIIIDPADADVARIAEHLASILRPSTGHAVPITSAGPSVRGAIVLRLSAGGTTGS